MVGNKSELSLYTANWCSAGNIIKPTLVQSMFILYFNTLYEFLWSTISNGPLMDNFEWASGYSERFGLHWVNYTLLNESPDTSATVAFQKESAKWFGNLATTNTLEPFEP